MESVLFYFKILILLGITFAAPPSLPQLKTEVVLQQHSQQIPQAQVPPVEEHNLNGIPEIRDYCNFSDINPSKTTICNEVHQLWPKVSSENATIAFQKYYDPETFCNEFATYYPKFKDAFKHITHCTINCLTMEKGGEIQVIPICKLLLWEFQPAHKLNVTTSAPVVVAQGSNNDSQDHVDLPKEIKKIVPTQPQKSKAPGLTVAKILAVPPAKVDDVPKIADALNKTNGEIKKTVSHDNTEQQIVGEPKPEIKPAEETEEDGEMKGNLNPFSTQLNNDPQSLFPSGNGEVPEISNEDDVEKPKEENIQKTQSNELIQSEKQPPSLPDNKKSETPILPDTKIDLDQLSNKDDDNLNGGQYGEVEDEDADGTDEDDGDDNIQALKPEIIHADNLNIQQSSKETFVDSPFVSQPSSNLFAYFLFIMFLVVVLYVAYHNKTKVLALILEGRRGGKGGRRKHTAAYRKLDSNLEEAITSSVSSHRALPIIY